MIPFVDAMGRFVRMDMVELRNWWSEWELKN